LVGWVAIPIGFVVEQIVADEAPEVGQSALVWTLTVFFIAQILRLAIAAAVRRPQRLALLFLLSSVVLWAAGSALLNAGGVPDLTHFPAPGELLFLASYVAMAAYLMVSAGRTRQVRLDTWLHLLVICGGTVSLTGTLLLTPIGALLIPLAASRNAPLTSHDAALLLLSGPVTGIPLLLFTAAARRLRLSTIGLLQYIGPIGQFTLAVFAYHEPFGPARLTGFVLIWIALILYSFDSIRAYRISSTAS